jgi:hypothetical protein
MGVSQLLWYVAHTRPRCEKKLLQFASGRNWMPVCLVTGWLISIAGKRLCSGSRFFRVMFFSIFRRKTRVVLQSDHLANLLEIADQDLFIRQLDEVMRALETDLEIRLAPTIGEGMRVKIKNGPLRGIEGWVEKRYGMTTVLLRLDFIGQAAAVKLDASDLELI